MSSSSTLGGRTPNTFREIGFTNWKKALNKDAGFVQHGESKGHLLAEQAYKHFLSSKPVDTLVSDERARQLTQKQATISKNRTVISKLFGVVQFLSKLNLPFRGHDESAGSLNKGVFQELVAYLAASGDEVLADHLISASENAQYTSPQIQNEMIGIIGSSIQFEIVQAVKRAQVFTVMMDETTDVSHKEQVAIFVRYVEDTVTGPNIQERFLAMVDTQNVTGEGLTNVLLETLRKHNLALSDVVGQGYDGGSNMMGAMKGVQARIRELNPVAIVTHCYCHSLNRALINSVCNKDNRYARNFFGTVELLYAFVAGSAMRHSYFLDQQLETNNTTFHLVGLSETRWNCRAMSLERLKTKGVLQAILNTLEHVADTTSDGKTRGKAVGLINAMQQFEFLICLCALHPVLTVLNTASEYMQSSNIDLMEAQSKMSTLKQEYKSMRSNNEKWITCIKEARDLATSLGVSSDPPDKRKTKVPCSSDNSVPRSAEVHFNGYDSYKINLYYNTLDHLLTELEGRFPSALSEFSCLQPRHMFAINAEQQVRCLADRYHQVDTERTVSQWRLSRHIFSGLNITSFTESYIKIPADYTDLCLLYRIAMTLPVTTASVERGFSKLSLVETKLRSTMTQDRLEALVLASAEKDILLQLSTDDLVSKFAAAAPRRWDLA